MCKKCVQLGPDRRMLSRVQRWRHRKDEAKEAPSDIFLSDAQKDASEHGDEAKNAEAPSPPPRQREERAYVDQEAFARDMLLLIVNHGISWDAAEKIIKVVNCHVKGRELHTNLPATKYKLKGMTALAPTCRLLPVCPECDFVFDRDQTQCAPCGLPRPRSKRQLLVNAVGARLKQMYGNKKLAQALAYATTRVPGDGDVWDGRVLRDMPNGAHSVFHARDNDSHTRTNVVPSTHTKLFPSEERLCVLQGSVCSDGTGFFSRGNLSWGPYTAVILNLPPALRGKFAVSIL